MRVFKKRKSNVDDKTVSEGLKKGFDYLRSGWVNWMNAKTSSFSKSTWIVLLSVLVLGGSLYNGLIIFKAFEPTDRSTLNVQKIKPSDQVFETGEPEISMKKDTLTGNSDEIEVNKNSELWKNR